MDRQDEPLLGQGGCESWAWFWALPNRVMGYRAPYSGERYGSNKNGGAESSCFCCPNQRLKEDDNQITQLDVLLLPEFRNFIILIIKFKQQFAVISDVGL